MADEAHDYHRGEMDIHEQVGTYHAFLALSKWFSLHFAVVLLFLVLMFTTKTGFIGSAAAALVLMVIGILLLRDKKKPH